MACRFHGVPTPCANGAGTIASPHKYWICSMSKMICAGVFARLGAPRIVPRRSRETQSAGWQGFWNRLKCNNRESKCQTQQAGHCTTQGMAGQPNLSVWVNLGHIGIQIDGSPIISVFIEKSFNDAGQVARICSCLAVAHLPPQIRASLAATTTEIKIVVDLIICSGTSPIEQSG